MDVQQLKDDAVAGKLSVDRLILVIEAQQRRIAELEEQIKSKAGTTHNGRQNQARPANRAGLSCRH